jgi:hypothetical protein
MRLHQQECHAPQLPCVLAQAPCPLCHRGWRYGGRHSKDDESGLLQAGLHCCIGKSCACHCRGGSYLCQCGCCQGGAYCRLRATCCGGECGHAPQASSQLGHNCASVVTCLVNRMVNIVGTSAKDRGCIYPHHVCCGMQLQVGS